MREHMRHTWPLYAGITPAVVAFLALVVSTAVAKGAL